MWEDPDPTITLKRNLDIPGCTGTEDRSGEDTLRR